jgi:predicted DsbA family dithiol-disulfide isomerase
MQNRVKAMGQAAGIILKVDESLKVNSLNAHRLIHLATDQGLGDQAVERLMKAYFTESQNLADTETLVKLMTEVGLDSQLVREMLADTRYQDLVLADEEAARQIGVSGVPFFLFDEKYAVSGAQPIEVFSQVLEKVQAEAAGA